MNMESIFLFYIFLYSFVENIVVRKNLNKIEMIKEKKNDLDIFKISPFSNTLSINYVSQFETIHLCFVLKLFFLSLKKEKEKRDKN